MLEATCSLELSERVQNENRNPEETEEVLASDSSKDASSSNISMISVRMDSEPC